MTKKKNSQINIGNVSGDVVFSQNQKGGTTEHEISKNKEQRKKSFFNNKYVLAIGLIAAILGILGYFGLQPSKTNNDNLPNEVTQQRKIQNPVIIDTITKEISLPTKDTIRKKNMSMGKKKKENKEEKPISIGDVSGDVVLSQNQTGGITAHTVNVNNDRNISQSVSNEISEILRTNNCEITIGALGMGGEPDKLANQLLIAAQNSGCTTNGVYHGVGFQSFNGLQIQVSQTNPLLNVARSLENILRKASIECTVVYGPNLSEGNIYLYVGYKP